MPDLHAIIEVGSQILKTVFAMAATVTIMGTVGLLGAMAVDRFGLVQNR